MNFTLVWQLAIRYLRGKRSANIVPVLSRISMIAIAISSGAMIVIFSVFNGEEGLVKDMYKAFYPDIRIKAARGKFFTLDNNKIAAVQQLPGVEHMSTVLEDNVMVVSNIDSQQRFVTLKGIDQHYFEVNNAQPFIIKGADSVSCLPIPTALLGKRIVDQMGLDVQNITTRINVYYFNKDASASSLDPTSFYQAQVFKPQGEFQVADEFDSKLVLVPLSAVEDLFKEKGRYSSLEIKLNATANAETVRAQLQKIVGDAYKVETRFEQNKTVYTVMTAEKWAVYAILVLALLIASFNMIGALSLLVLEKRKDMAILKAMGAEPTTIRRIFLLEGVLWTLTGGVTGVVIGALVCAGQQHFKWIKMSGSFVVDAFPVEMKWMDFVLVVLTVMIVGVIAAWYPSVRATRTEDPSLKAT